MINWLIIRCNSNDDKLLDKFTITNFNKLNDSKYISVSSSFNKCFSSNDNGSTRSFDEFVIFGVIAFLISIIASKRFLTLGCLN